MFFRSFLRVALISCIAVMLGCSDSPGGGGGIGGTGQVVPVVGSGLVVGSIDGFGSVIINGRRYTTSDTSTSIDGEDADLADLRSGMTIRARVDHALMTADRLQYQPLLLGTIADIETDSMSIAAINQQVLFTDNTIFEGVSLEGLRPEMQVEVSGVRDTTSSIVASFVRLTSIDGDPVWVGEVNNRIAGRDKAVIAGVTIDYSEFRTTLGLTIDEFRSTFLIPGTILRVEVDDDADASDSTAFSAIDSVGGDTAGNTEETIADTIDDIITVTGLSTVDQLEAAAGEYTIVPQTEVVTASGVAIEDLQVVENERVIISGVVEEPDCDLVSGGLVCLDAPGPVTDTANNESGASAEDSFWSFIVSVQANKVVFLDRP